MGIVTIYKITRARQIWGQRRGRGGSAMEKVFQKEPTEMSSLIRNSWDKECRGVTLPTPLYPTQATSTQLYGQRSVIKKKTCAGGRVRISCSRQAEAKSARDHHHCHSCPGQDSVLVCGSKHWSLPGKNSTNRLSVHASQPGAGD